MGHLAGEGHVSPGVEQSLCRGKCKTAATTFLLDTQGIKWQEGF